MLFCTVFPQPQWKADGNLDTLSLYFQLLTEQKLDIIQAHWGRNNVELVSGVQSHSMTAF